MDEKLKKTIKDCSKKFDIEKVYVTLAKMSNILLKSELTISESVLVIALLKDFQYNRKNEMLVRLFDDGE